MIAAMAIMRGMLRPALALFVLLSTVTGVVYPLLTTVIAQAVMPDQAHGSLVRRDGAVIGSRLVGQSFTAPDHFWSRPSASGGWPYNALASGGSNLGPTHPALVETVQARVAALRAAHPDNRGPVPIDLVTASASGLDPHISPAAARYQAARVARARGLDEATVLRLVDAHTAPRQFGRFGDPRVDVLGLNLALDRHAR